MRRMKVDLEMASPQGGEDEYEDYEPDAYYENTRGAGNPKDTIPRKPPVAPKPPMVSSKQEPYSDYREQEEYLVPKKTEVIEERKKDAPLEETQNAPKPELTFRKPSACTYGRRCKITAIVCAIVTAFVLGCVLVFAIMYSSYIKNTAQDQASNTDTLHFIIGNKTGRIAAMLTPQAQDTSVFVGVTTREAASDTTKTGLGYRMEIKLGESVLWSNAMVFDRALTKTITSFGDITVIMGMSLPNAMFSGDTTLVLPASAMAKDYTLIFQKPPPDVYSVCHIFTGNISSTKISFTSTPQINAISTFGFKHIELESFSILSLSAESVDFTGVRIQSDHPVAVSVASEQNRTTMVPLTIDTIYPTQMLGMSLYVPHFDSGSNATYTTQVRVMALSNDTVVSLAGNQKTTATLEGGKFKEVESNGPLSVYCTKPCSVALFIHMDCLNYKPQAMVAIPSENLFLSGKVFFAAAFDIDQYPNAHLAIVVENKEAKFIDIKLNGHAIDATWKQFSDGKYVGAYIETIKRGTNTLESANLKFMAYLYGIHCGNRNGAFAHVIAINP